MTPKYPSPNAFRTVHLGEQLYSASISSNLQGMYTTSTVNSPLLLFGPELEQSVVVIACVATSLTLISTSARQPLGSQSEASVPTSKPNHRVTIDREPSLGR